MPPILSPNGAVGFRWLDEADLEVYWVNTGETIKVLDGDEGAHYADIDSSPDGRLALVSVFYRRGSGTAQMALFDTSTWQVLREWRSRAFAFSPDGRWMAVELGGMVVVWPTP
jgi:hypothetical protein